MSGPRLILRLTICTAALSVALSPARPVPENAPEPVTRYELPTPPQQAQGDFDGDGRIDTALIHGRAGAGQISIHLSGSLSTVDLDAAVSGVVQGDVDHDGDLDLVAATPSGALLIWINDGHGRFTRQPASTTHGVSSEPVVAETAARDALSIGLAGVPLLSSPPGKITLVEGGIRLLIGQTADRIRAVVPPPLRAPPLQPV
jgi:hypothetical protein